MGKFTIEKWKCDRCGMVEDKRPIGFYPHYEIHISEHYDTAGGPAITWRELCPKCNVEVGKLLQSMRFKP
jgi:ribosomal protein S27AE